MSEKSEISDKELEQVAGGNHNEIAANQMNNDNAIAVDQMKMHDINVKLHHLADMASSTVKTISEANKTIKRNMK